MLNRVHYKLYNYNNGIIITRKDCYLNSTSSFSCSKPYCCEQNDKNSEYLQTKQIQKLCTAGYFNLV